MKRRKRESTATGPAATAPLILEEALQQLETQLNRLACDRIVAGDIGTPVTEALLHWGKQIARIESERAISLASGLLTIADGAGSEDSKLTAAQALLTAGEPPPLKSRAAEPRVVDTDAELAALVADPEIGELFIAEALDHLGTIEAALLALDSRPGDLGLLNDIFRPFHTVKGNASALGLTSLEEVAHRVENLLDLARAGKKKIGNAEVDVVLRAVDVLTLMIRDLGARLNGQAATPTAAAATALMRQVDRLTAGSTADEGPSADMQTSSTPAGSADGRGAWGDSPMRQDGAQTSIKVDTRKLDNLVDMIGELIVVQSLIHEDPALVHLIDGRLARNLGQFKRITAELHRNSMALRMVPIRQAFQKVARVVRDLSRKADKPVDLVLSGEDTELDRKMVEEITDPLMHMARNSLDHGIESAEERVRAGKPARSTLTLSAYHQGSQILVEIADDGAGLATDKILERARSRGLVSADVTPAAADIHRLIFEPGFSTADAVTEVSGRGVGMDVVRRNIESLRGRIAIATERGKGTVFTITIPLTLAVLDGLLVRVGGDRLVLPASAVRESLRPLPQHVHAVHGEPRMIQVRESVLPLVALGELVGIPGAATDPIGATVVVMEAGGSRIGLVVDELLNKQEVVVKSLGDTFSGVCGLAGGAILGDGRIGLIVDPHGIMELMRGERRAA